MKGQTVVALTEYEYNLFFGSGTQGKIQSERNSIEQASVNSLYIEKVTKMSTI